MTKVHRTSVLIVDEDLGTRALLAAVLSGELYAVDTAPGAREALDAIGRKQYELILLDSRMAAAGGPELLSQLSALCRRGGCVVLMMSAEEEKLPVPLGAQVAALLHKPFDLKELKSVLASCLIRPRPDRTSPE